MRRYACLIPLAASFSRSKDSALMMCSILQASAFATLGSTPAAISFSVKKTMALVDALRDLPAHIRQA